MVRQDLWALPTTMEAFIICVRGLEYAVELLVHPLAVTKAELMDIFRHLGEFYCRVSVATLVEVYKDHVTDNFRCLRK